MQLPVVGYGGTMHAPGAERLTPQFYQSTICVSGFLPIPSVVCVIGDRVVASALDEASHRGFLLRQHQVMTSVTGVVARRRRCQWCKAWQAPGVALVGERLGVPAA